MINTLLSHFAAACPGGNFLTFNHNWYTYLNSTSINGVCTPQITGISDIWLIVAAVLEILLRVAALAAVAFVIYGGIEYTLSRGESEKIAHARGTILNALIGLAVAVTSAAVINFIASGVK